MKPLLFLAGLFLYAVANVMGQSIDPDFRPEVKIIQHPTCNNPNGEIVLTEPGGNPITDLIFLYRLPDSTFLGSGANYTGLRQGIYLGKRFLSDGIVMPFKFSISNYQPLDYLKLSWAFANGVSGDTCSQSKGSIHLGKGMPLYDSLALSQVQWTWSNGQTGPIVSNLKAGITYWLIGSHGPDCPYYIPFLFGTSWGPNNIDSLPFNYATRINKDTVFFKIRNANTVNVGFNNIIKPLCQTKTGSVTATVYNSGTPPFHWEWNNDSLKPTIQNVKCGTYIVQVTDSLGCVGANSFNLSFYNPADYSVSLSILKPDSCLFGQGSVSAQVSGGTRPYKYRWNSDYVGTSDSVFSGASQGAIYLRVADSLGCETSSSLNLPGQNPMTVTLTPVNPDCLGNGGIINLTAAGGVEPYKVFWNGYPSENQLFLDSLTPGSYSGFVADSNGCKVEFDTYLSIPGSCYRTLSLGVFRDGNNDCEKQEPELPIKNNYVRYKILNKYESRYLDNTNNSIQVIPGVQEVQLQRKPHFIPACLDSNWQITNLVISDLPTTTFKNLGLGVSQVRKNTLVQMFAENAFRPGFTTPFRITLQNDGNQVLESGYLKLTLPSDVSFAGSSQPNILLEPNVVRFQISGLTLEGNSTFRINLYLAETVPLSLIKTFEILLEPLIGETELNDNLNSFQFITTGSFDPNDIVVQPAPYIKPSRTELSYRIRFQNLGTYYAENVVVVDTLPENVDPSSLLLGTSSHRPTMIEIKGRVLTVRFFRIYLPDSASNEPGSHGEINFKISRLADLPIGTKIRNSASIYFDFNAPVKTNTSEVEVFDPSIQLGSSVFPYPNPGSTQFRLMGSDADEVDVFDLSGKKIRHLYQNEKGAFSLSQISSGIYFLRFEHNGKPKTGKLMVSK